MDEKGTEAAIQAATKVTDAFIAAVTATAATTGALAS